MVSVTAAAGLQMKAWLDRATARYQRSMILANVFQAQGVELDSIRSGIADALAQTFVGLATWGLANWETELGLAFDPSLNTAQRRERILARLRGFGTATVAVVKAVAESYDHGEINVVENADSYKIIIRFISTLGVPSNLPDLTAAVRAVVPANTIIEYEYNYTTWDNWSALALTWTAVNALGLTWDQHGVYA